MLIRVDHHSGVPVYRQLVDQVRFHVASGLLAPGEEMPSTRSLSAELALNPMTVSKAYALLEREGLLERRPGLPLVVSALSTRERDAERRARLSDQLRASATMARQLGIGPAEALRLFRALLGEQERERR